MVVENIVSNDIPYDHADFIGTIRRIVREMEDQIPTAKLRSITDLRSMCSKCQPIVVHI